jgi:SAM-dependent methyltransferase
VTGACPACASPRTRRGFAAAGVEWRRCAECGTLFDPDPPGPDEVAALYEGEGYFVKGEAAEDGTLWGYADDYLADRASSELKFERVLRHLERYAGPGRLADVGCGPGFLLPLAERRGWEASGADLNEWAVRYAREELGADAVHGGLDALGLEDGALDAVTMLDLIEHVPDPDPLLAEAARAVRPGGAVAILTPDAGSPVSRAMGARWPEVRRPGEHAVVYSVAGLSARLREHGFAAASWHWIGKTASLATLAADVAPAAPGLAGAARSRLEGLPTGERIVDFDPRTKFCLYARRVHDTARPGGHRPARVPARPERIASVEGAIRSELEDLAAARRFCDWMFDLFAGHVGGDVVEVGAGIGTFSERILARGPESLLLVEPEKDLATTLAERFGEDRRVTVSREELPGAPSLAPDRFDLVVSQNVLEHVGDDRAAIDRLGRSLRPGGRLALVVPADPRLFGPLDDAYGHWRRYEAGDLRGLLVGAGLVVEELRPVNALGVAGWRAKNLRPGARIGSGALAAYEALVRAWRPLEERRPPGRGLSLFALARR